MTEERKMKKIENVGYLVSWWPIPPVGSWQVRLSRWWGVGEEKERKEFGKWICYSYWANELIEVNEENMC